MKLTAFKGSQFEDYAKYNAAYFSGEEKARRRKEEFPKDCRRAYDMGVRFALRGLSSPL